MAKELKVVGQSVPRIDGVAKVTGTARYTGDVWLPDMLFAKILYSPYPHARIKKIDLSKARALPGVKCIITGQEAPDKYITFMLAPRWQDKLLFARDKVRYAGEEIAAVAAVSEDIAKQAIRLIEIEFEPLPAALTLEAALQEGAPLVHARLGTNVAAAFKREIGDVDRAFAEADVLVEADYTTPATSHCVLEPHAIVAQFVGDDLHLWMSTQAPYYVRKDIEMVLGIPLANIHINEITVGGGFGSKSLIAESDLVAVLLARNSGRPVKLILTREEEMTVTRTRHPHAIHLKAGVKKDGTILAWEARIRIDNGAYNDVGPLLPGMEAARVGSLYPAPNVRVEAETVYTNMPYGGRFRAYGNMQITFALESHMDSIARRLGIDPLSLRLKNAVRPGEKTPWGWKVSSCGLAECLEAVCGQIGPKEPGQQGQLIGIGHAGMTHGSGGLEGDYSAAFVQVRDGEVVVLTGITEIGQGAATILSQIAAETLGVTLEHVKIKTMDTDVTPIDLGSRANRVTFMAGRAVQAAAEDARDQILRIAGQILLKPAAELVSVEGEIFWEQDPAVKIPLRSATSSHDPKGGAAVLGRGVYDHPIARGECTFVYGGDAVKIAVDVETGQITVLAAVGAHDLGRAINPQLAEGQIEGGMVQGIGFALMEELVRENGITLNQDFRDYKIPTMADIPAITTILVETNDPYGPFGAKGLGEPTSVPMAPALANAIADAVGVRITELPLTPEKVLRAIEKLKKEGPEKR